MNPRRRFDRSGPALVALRERLTRLVGTAGWSPQTVEAMVMGAATSDPLARHLWRTGPPNGGLVYCIEGALRLECVSETGTRRIVALVAPGEFTPSPTAACRRGYRVRMSPHDETTIATWSPGVLREIMLTVPEQGMPDFLARMRLGWTPDGERWAILSMLEAPERIAVVLQDLAARFGVPDGDGMRIDVPLNDRHVAALIGTNRERVNRCMGVLIRNGLVRRLPQRRLWVHPASWTENVLRARRGRVSIGPRAPAGGVEPNGTCESGQR